MRCPQKSRRQFIQLATMMAAALATRCDGTDPTAGGPPLAGLHPCLPPRPAAWLTPSNPDVDLPHLGGAPDTPQGWSVAAFVDAIVPGAHRDETGAPGGIDVGAPALFFDPELPAAAFVGPLVLVLDLNANSLVPGTTFGTLPADRREEAVEQALEVDLLEFAVQMAKLAYYSSEGAGCHLGYPGANPGYVDDPDFGFGVPLATEITEDGNYP